RFDVRVAEKDLQERNGEVIRKPRSMAATPRRGSTHTAPVAGIVSSIQGTIVSVKATSGQVVEAGQVLFIIEAMKMENEITAPYSGTLGEVRVQTGQVVEAGMVLATYQH